MKNLLHILTFAILATVITVPPATAQTRDGRITISGINSFIYYMNQAINSKDPIAGSNALASMIGEDARFKYTTIVHDYSAGTAGGYNKISQDYRYPTYPYTTSGSFRSLDKYEMLTFLERKKYWTPQYNARISITGINMNPWARHSASVNVDFVETGIFYDQMSPYNPKPLITSYSKCIMYLASDGASIFITQMDCNTTVADMM